MNQLNRRQWLRTASITGAFSLLNLPKSIASDSFIPPPNAGFFHNGIVRLSSNENPYAPAPKVRAAMTNAFDKACRYPGVERLELTEMIAKKEGVSPAHILTTVGSREGLNITGLTYGINGGEIVSADPVYKALLTYAERLGAYIHRVPLDKDLQHDLEAMEKRITGKTTLVFVCNPNNPTGTLLPPNKFRNFCNAVSDRTVVFSDEAYFDYITEPNYPSMVELVKEGKSVIVSRTFSKVYGLAGIRVGYLVARPDIINRIAKHQVDRPNMLGIYAAMAALEDKEFYNYSLKMNAESRAHIYATLEELGLPYQESHANFVFFKSGRVIEELIGEMMTQGVKVGRPFPPLTDWCRVSTSTIEDMEAFRKGMKSVFG